MGCFPSHKSFKYGQSNNDIQISSIDSNDLRQIINVLSSDSLEGRRTGTLGEHKAAQFIAEGFYKIGLASVDERHYQQPISMIQTSWGEVHITYKNKHLRNFNEMAFLGHLPQNKEVEKEVVFGGDGTDLLLNQMDVKDKVVILLVDNLRTNYSKLETLKNRKAFAAFFCNPKSNIQFNSIKNGLHDHILQKRLFLESQDTTTLFREFILPAQRIEEIMGISISKLKKGILEKHISYFPTSKVNIQCERLAEELSTQNIIGIIPGKNANEVIHVMAHYDHLGKDKNTLYPGADDNASGIAAMMEIAKLLVNSKPLKSILFIAFTGEEEGLKGSYYYTKHPLLPLAGTSATVNIDMVGRKDERHALHDDYLYVLGTDTSLALDRINTTAAKLTKSLEMDYTFNNSKDIMGFYFRSDQLNFYSLGIPSLFFFGGTHTDYHKPSDNANKIDIELLKRRTIHIANVIHLLANQTELILMKPEYINKPKLR